MGCAFCPLIWISNCITMVGHWGICVWRSPVPVKDHGPEHSVLDESALQQLLNAAYVVQEHNDRLRSSPGESKPADYASELSDLEQTLRSRNLDFESAAELIAERAQKITAANSVVIGMLEKGEMVYRGCAGEAAGQEGSKAQLDFSLAECLRTGMVIAALDVEKDPRLGREFSQRSGSKALITVPVRVEGKVRGALEARFDRINSFGEPDVRACEALADTVAMAMSDAKALEQSSAEQSAMTSALDQLLPHLDRLVGEDETDFVQAVSNLLTNEAAPKKPLPANVVKEDSATEPCRSCGHPLAREQSFCGICGSSRFFDIPADPGGPPSKWPTLHQLQIGEDGEADVFEASKTTQRFGPEAGNEFEVANGLYPEEGKLTATHFADLNPDTMEFSAMASPYQDAPAFEGLEGDEVEQEWEPEEKRKWRDSLPLERWNEVWKEHYASFYLVAASILLGIVLVGWAMQPPPPAEASTTNGARQQQAALKPDLTLFEELMVNLGLAEPPAARPVHTGNPDARVWVDLRTGLYYCPGSELYGNTRGGKFATQRDARQDRFEPAAKKPCE